jgi:Uncharacterized protein conserved in bacteria (DUF2188)
MAKERRHVVPNADGGWDVKKPGADRASSHHDRQADAERRAKADATTKGGGEVIIHRPERVDPGLRHGVPWKRPEPSDKYAPLDLHRRTRRSDEMIRWSGV